MNFLNVVRPVVTSLLLFSAQAALALPQAFQAQFSVAKGSMQLGNLNASLRYNGNQYHYQKHTNATGLAALLTGIKITENVNGQFSGQNLIPQNYIYNQSRRSKARIDKVNFNANKATGSYKGNPYSLTVSRNTLDRASLELAIARDLSLRKSRLTYPVVEKGELKNYAFSILGNEKIVTPAGTFHTVKVRVIRDTNARDTIFWMAKELDFMPAKIQHEEKGDTITTVIQSYKPL